MEELSHSDSADFTLRWAVSLTSSAEQAEFTVTSDPSKTDRVWLGVHVLLGKDA